MENVHTEELEVSIFKGWNLTKWLKRKEVQRQNIQDSGQIHQNSWSCLTTTQIYIYTYVTGEERLLLVLTVFELNMNELKVEVFLV